MQFIALADVLIFIPMPPDIPFKNHNHMTSFMVNEFYLVEIPNRI